MVSSLASLARRQKLDHQTEVLIKTVTDTSASVNDVAQSQDEALGVVSPSDANFRLVSE